MDGWWNYRANNLGPNVISSEYDDAIGSSDAGPQGAVDVETPVGGSIGQFADVAVVAAAEGGLYELKRVVAKVDSAGVVVIPAVLEPTAGGCLGLGVILVIGIHHPEGQFIARAYALVHAECHVDGIRGGTGQTDGD